MKVRQIAKVLGRRGGRVRAQRLSKKKRSEIASLGGQARATSLQSAKLIRENFRYLASIEALSPKPPVTRISTFEMPLPDIGS
ncbi:MAG: hypothetical protein R3257_03360 [bacterium]|nr:hypothetical protein [bacterium]